MANFKYTSWGRTRQPKNLAGAHGAEVVTATGAPSGATAGYSTENQRYIHLYLDTTTSTNTRTITVYGYYYAFGVWVALLDTSGVAVSITAINTTAHKIHEIAGVDRVYFRANSTLNADDEMFAAGSTFQGS
jgi:hypothetical protein